MNLPGRDRFRADPRWAAVLEAAWLPPSFTPPGFWDEGRYVEVRGVHALMRDSAYVPDLVQYGAADAWVPQMAGDCEDKALAAHELLAARGWSKSWMRVMVRPARGWPFLPGHLKAHAVLCLHVHLYGTRRRVALDNTRAGLAYLEDLKGDWAAV